MRKVLFVSFIFIAVFAFAGCASSGEPTETGSVMHGELAGAPSWVLGGSAKKGEICGVGSAGGSRNVSIMRSSAMGRGRTEIARTLEVQVKSMLKDYQATTTGGEYFGQAANDEQHIEDVSKQITNTTLSGTVLRETWVSNPGTLYALVCVDVDTFKDTLNGMKQLNEQVRAAVVERANKAFDELDEATSR
jgi:hypothetical protein